MSVEKLFKQYKNAVDSFNQQHPVFNDKNINLVYLCFYDILWKKICMPDTLTTKPTLNTNQLFNISSLGTSKQFYRNVQNLYHDLTSPIFYVNPTFAVFLNDAQYMKRELITKTGINEILRLSIPQEHAAFFRTLISVWRKSVMVTDNMSVHVNTTQLCDYLNECETMLNSMYQDFYRFLTVKSNPQNSIWISAEYNRGMLNYVFDPEYTKLCEEVSSLFSDIDTPDWTVHELLSNLHHVVLLNLHTTRTLDYPLLRHKLYQDFMVNLKKTFSAIKFTSSISLVTDTLYPDEMSSLYESFADELFLIQEQMQLWIDEFKNYFFCPVTKNSLSGLCLRSDNVLDELDQCCDQKLDFVISQLSSAIQTFQCNLIDTICRNYIVSFSKLFKYYEAAITEFVSMKTTVKRIIHTHVTWNNSFINGTNNVRDFKDPLSSLYEFKNTITNLRDFTEKGLASTTFQKSIIHSAPEQLLTSNFYVFDNSVRQLALDLGNIVYFFEHNLSILQQEIGLDSELSSCPYSEIMDFLCSNQYRIFCSIL